MCTYASKIFNYLFIKWFSIEFSLPYELYRIVF